MNSQRFDAVRADQLRCLRLELRQLENCDFRLIVHYPAVYRNAV